MDPFFFFMIFINIYLASSGLGCNKDPSATTKTSGLPCIMWNPFVGVHGLSNCGLQALLLRGMWDLPGPGTKPASPTFQGKLLTTRPLGKPLMDPFFYLCWLISLCALLPASHKIFRGLPLGCWSHLLQRIGSAWQFGSPQGIL